MFNRPDFTYQINHVPDGSIKDDIANPLIQISKLVKENSRVLDIGAGNGSLGRLFSQQGRSIIIDGIEPNGVAAALAKPFYREVYVGFLNDYLKIINFENYDYIVLADVIEHIDNPQSFLNQLTPLLGNKVTLLVSIPNIAFGAVRLSLSRGEFNYVDSGILERTHLRFFTYSTAIALFKTVGLYASVSINLCRSFYRSEFKRSSIGFPGWSFVRYAFMRDARAYQYLFCLVRYPTSDTKRMYVGANSFNIFFDAFFYWSWTKKIARKLLLFLNYLK
jgi:2-polyprenyl-3-methyl-5-hydroxy-6-metoxy-1,4-benzoquinol methylase